MNFINLPLWEVAGTMVIGSLWLGALLAFFFWILAKIIGRGSPTFNYYLALSMLLLFTVGNIYITYDATTQASLRIDNDIPRSIAHPLAGFSIGDQFTESNLITWISSPIGLIGPYKSQLGLIWWVGMVLLSVRFLGGYVLAQRLKYRRIRLVEDYWQDKLASLAKTIGIKEKVLLLESYLIESPITLGFWRPVILMPVGLLTTIPVAQLEAVLLHELYHIKYRDYCINLFHTAIEIVFFYHPFVWWLSSIIRKEREYRCDDGAVVASGDRISLAKALTHIKMSHFKSQNPITMSLTGKKTQLSQRIYRLFEPRPSFTYKMRALLSICFLVVISSAFTLYTTQLADKTFNNGTWDKSSLVHFSIDEEVEQGKEPIYMKDGKRISKNEMESIAPEQISSVEVYKGEDAVKKYGEDAQDGVILIYTKDYTGSRMIENEEDLKEILKDGPASSSAKFDIRTTESKVNIEKAAPENNSLAIVLEGKAPLFILNGEHLTISEAGKVPTEIGSLDPATIDHISVLKGEEATRIYGKKGTDGVIIVITKDYKDTE